MTIMYRQREWKWRMVWSHNTWTSAFRRNTKSETKTQILTQCDDVWYASSILYLFFCILRLWHCSHAKIKQICLIHYTKCKFDPSFKAVSCSSNHVFCPWAWESSILLLQFKVHRGWSQEYGKAMWRYWASILSRFKQYKQVFIFKSFKTTFLKNYLFF